jgi:hypothetical protein
MCEKRFVSLAVLIAMALGACTPTTPYLDANFGHAVNAAKAQQIINPEAGKNTDPVAGLDGTSAKESIERYHSTFKEPPPTFDIFVGSAGAAR